MQRKLTTIVLLAGLGLSGIAQATLIDRGGGLIYDDVLNITWLQNANYGAGSSYDNGFNTIEAATDGRMTLGNAVAWADALVYYDSVRGVSYSDWRLPSVDPIDASFNYAWSNNGSTDLGYGNSSPHSELAYMYYVNLAKLGYCTPNGGGSSATCNAQSGGGLYDGPMLPDGESLFTNLLNGVYWSGTQYPPYSNHVWGFDTTVGSQYPNYKDYLFFAWAVRPGDVAAVNNVPEPQTLAMLGLGLLGLAAARRRGGLCI